VITLHSARTIERLFAHCVLQTCWLPVGAVGIQIRGEDDQQPCGYVLESNASTGNRYGMYIWNLGNPGFPPEDILSMPNNQIFGNTVQDIWKVP
jgi:hypothetical protein